MGLPLNICQHIDGLLTFNFHCNTVQHERLLNPNCLTLMMKSYFTVAFENLILRTSPQNGLTNSVFLNFG